MLRHKPALAGVARALRHNQTDADNLLWANLRLIEPGNFRRQVLIGSYIVDFVSLKKKLIIEVDGAQHNEPSMAFRDKQRSEWLKSQGFKILRFWNNDVLQNLDGIFFEILSSCHELSPSTNLSHQGREKHNSEASK
jgi:very-short-patch-repair endonuclease